MASSPFSDLTLAEMKKKLRGSVEAPDFKNLRHFVDWWMEHKPYDVPLGEIYITDDASSFPIFRKDNYQVELYIINNFTRGLVYTHSHPGVELIQIRLSDEDTTNEAFGQYSYLKNGDFHGVTSTPDSDVIKVVFLAFEKWLEGTQPTSVAIQYRGRVAGDLQKNLIEKYYPKRVDEKYYSYVSEQDLIDRNENGLEALVEQLINN